MSKAGCSEYLLLDAVQALPELQSDKGLMTGSSQSTLTGALSARAGMLYLIGQLCCHICSKPFDRAEPAAVLLRRSFASCQHTLHGPCKLHGRCFACTAACLPCPHMHPFDLECSYTCMVHC